MSVEISLPYPPTVNHYWKHTRQGRHYVSAEGKAYQEAVRLACRKLGLPKLCGAVSVNVAVFLPDKRRRDLDNILKALLDAVNAAGVIEDDSLIVKLSLEKKGVLKGGLVVIKMAEVADGMLFVECEY